MNDSNLVTDTPGASPASPPPMPAQRKWMVMSGALLLIGLTVWQVTAKRDDWPLSNFNLYSFIAGRSGSRYVVVAFGPEGETKIARW